MKIRIDLLSREKKATKRELVPMAQSNQLARLSSNPTVNRNPLKLGSWFVGACKLRAHTKRDGSTRLGVKGFAGCRMATETVETVGRRKDLAKNKKSRKKKKGRGKDSGKGPRSGCSEGEQKNPPRLCYSESFGERKVPKNHAQRRKAGREVDPGGSNARGLINHGKKSTNLETRASYFNRAFAWGRRLNFTVGDIAES